jgi:hypothetical protein
MSGSVWSGDLRCLDLEVMQPGCEASYEGTDYAFPLNDARRCIASHLSPLVGRHPAKKPGECFIVAGDFYIDQQASLEKRCAMSKALLSDSCSSSKRS